MRGINKSIGLIFLLMICMVSCGSSPSKWLEVGPNVGEYIYFQDSSKDKLPVGDITTKRSRISNKINQLVVLSCQEVEYEKSDKAEIVMTGPENILKYIGIEEKGTTLWLGLSKQVRRINFTGVTIKVYLPDIKEVSLKTVGIFKADAITGESFTINAESASEVDIDKMDVTVARIFAQGASKVVIDQAKSATLNCFVNGAGNMNFGSLTANKFTATVNGAGVLNAELNEIGRMSVQAVGASKVNLSGTAEVVTLTSTGDSEISAENLKCKNFNDQTSGLGRIFR